MHVVTAKHLQQAMRQFPDAASEIQSWHKIAKASRWKNFVEVRQVFRDADDVDEYVVFNIRHNRYRLIAAVHYAKAIDGRMTLGHVYIGSFMTHKEYDRWCAATGKKRAEWLHF